MNDDFQDMKRRVEADIAATRATMTSGLPEQTREESQALAGRQDHDAMVEKTTASLAAVEDEIQSVQCRLMLHATLPVGDKRATAPIEERVAVGMRDVNRKGVALVELFGRQYDAQICEALRPVAEHVVRLRHAIHDARDRIAELHLPKVEAG